MLQEEIIDNIIYGRVEPHIYAFKTNTVPDYLKVGDTYRPVWMRLKEWQTAYYHDLVKQYEHSAMADDKTFFRDYAVHLYLIDHGFSRITPGAFPDVEYLSDEFFQNAEAKDVDDAIKDIKRSYRQHEGYYKFYNLADRIPKGEEHFERNADWEPRENQRMVIDNFMNAVNAGHTNLLMYAVMRFGKSFTALCCAKKMKARLTVVVCGKADVVDEWQENVERQKILAGFKFVTATDMQNQPECVTALLKNGNSVVVFLTLQDLLGQDIKEKHADLFKLNSAGKLELLIIDETHFAARSAETGKVLREGIDKISKEEDPDELDKVVKHFSPKVKLHLSGTPYRVLLGGEFKKDDIISSVQYSDIAEAKREWGEKKENVDKEEWKNPYFGFPQMIRFAFHFNESSLKRLRQLKKDGVPFGLDELFEPHETKKQGNFQEFIYEKEVLDLLKAIDGSKEDGNIFPFLDYDKIRNGQMCHHIVMVLPYRASCDAMEKLIRENDFRHLGEYKLLNISGFNAPSRYTRSDKVKRVKMDIHGAELAGQKTITLTAGRMLTGTTVPEWDTMIFLKETKSPQEYDQATYRIQSQFVETIKGTDGSNVKRDMKPQTLLVDFDPDRMFRIESEKALISNVNSARRGYGEQKEKLTKELSISPIIYVNRNCLRLATPTDITAAVRRYSAERSVRDEAEDVGIDINLFSDEATKLIISQQPEIDGKAGIFNTSATKKDDDGDEVTIPTDNNGDIPSNNTSDGSSKITEDDTKSLCKRLKTYYFKLMLFAYLSDLKEESLNDIIDHIENDKDGKRIGYHLGINTSDLRIIRDNISPTILNELEEKIQNIDELGNDPNAKVETALRKFSKLSKGEIVTSQTLAEKMIRELPKSVTAKTKFLDIAAKEGEFAYAAFKYYGPEIRNNVWSIPTSGAAYECTRKIYSMLGMPIEHVFSNFTSFDLIDPMSKDEILKKLKDIGFGVTFGNPPYQDNRATDRAGVNTAFASAIYPFFVDTAIETSTDFVSLITPSRWLTKTGQGVSDAWVDKMIDGNHILLLNDFYNSNDLFEGIELKGGANYFLYSPSYNGKCIYTLNQNGETVTTSEYLDGRGAGIVIRDQVAPGIIDKIEKIEGKYYQGDNFSKLVGPQHFFDKDGLLTTRWKGYHMEKSEEYSIKYYVSPQTITQGYAWIKLADIPKNQEVKDYNKVFISKAYNGGDSFPHQIVGRPFYGEPNSVCSQTYLVIGFTEDNRLTEIMCRNIVSYIKTKFVRYMIFIKKKTQDNPSSVWQFVPLQDFTSSSDIDWSQSVADIDRRLYKKYGLDKEEIDFIERTIKPME